MLTRGQEEFSILCTVRRSALIHKILQLNFIDFVRSANVSKAHSEKESARPHFRRGSALTERAVLLLDAEISREIAKEFLIGGEKCPLREFRPTEGPILQFEANDQRVGELHVATREISKPNAVGKTVERPTAIFLHM